MYDLIKLKMKMKLVIQKRLSLDPIDEEKAIVLKNAQIRLEKQIDLTKDIIKKV